jgi:hypothetical protein
MLMVSSDTSYFLSRAGLTRGPLTASELEAYVAYGSVKPDDLLCTSDAPEWITVREWKQALESREVVAEEVEAELPTWKLWLHRIAVKLQPKSLPQHTPRRRAVRFREWKYVPDDQRSTLLIRDLIVGFIFFPPRLWSACSRVFSRHIFRHSTDEAGYLKIWPSAMESVCTVLVFLNAIYWLVLVVEFQTHALPFLKDAAGLVEQGIRDWSTSASH